MAVSYATDIRPRFRPIDINRMGFFCDLASHDDVKTKARELLGRLKGETGPVMPPVSTGGPWSADNIALFEKWIDEGCQP